MKSFVNYFKENFYEKMLQPNGNNPIRNRADSWIAMLEAFDTKHHDNLRILESGCIRADHGDFCFGDDGCSTWIFDRWAQYVGGGIVTSVDINSKNVEYAKSLVTEKVNVVCSDSIKYFYNIPPDQKFDLIYLDSLDIDKGDPLPSQIHALKELTACLKNTMSGTIIMVDDCDVSGKSKMEFFLGKGNYVKEFLDNIHADLIYQGYQLVYML